MFNFVRVQGSPNAGSKAKWKGAFEKQILNHEVHEDWNVMVL